MTTTCTMILGDCLEVMPKLTTKCSLVLADLPYGKSNLAWDSRLDLKEFWDCVSLCVLPSWLCVAYAAQPFTTDLVCSNRTLFRYDLVWVKRRSTGFFNAKKAPLRKHESILIFGQGSLYNPQMTSGKRIIVTKDKHRKGFFGTLNAIDRKNGLHDGTLRYPASCLEINENDLRRDSLNGHQSRLSHPTQKPIALLDWLVRTYSNKGDMLLDPTAGSFTSCVAAASCGRSSVGIEKEENYFDLGVDRMRKHVRDNLLDVKIEVRR